MPRCYAIDAHQAVTLWGRVTDDRGCPLAGQTVEVIRLLPHRPPEPIAAGVTVQDGCYAFTLDDVPPQAAFQVAVRGQGGRPEPPCPCPSRPPRPEPPCPCPPRPPRPEPPCPRPPRPPRPEPPCPCPPGPPPCPPPPRPPSCDGCPCRKLCDWLGMDDCNWQRKLQACHRFWTCQDLEQPGRLPPPYKPLFPE